MNEWLESNHWYQWFYDGFWSSKPLVPMVLQWFLVWQPLVPMVFLLPSSFQVDPPSGFMRATPLKAQNMKKKKTIIYSKTLPPQYFRSTTCHDSSSSMSQQKAHNSDPLGGWPPFLQLFCQTPWLKLALHSPM